MRWMNHKKSRVMDFFRRIDKDQDGKITRQEFIDGILASSESSHSSRPRPHLDSLHLLCRSRLYFWLNSLS